MSDEAPETAGGMVIVSVAPSGSGWFVPFKSGDNRLDCSLSYELTSTLYYVLDSLRRINDAQEWTSGLETSMTPSHYYYISQRD